MAYSAADLNTQALDAMKMHTGQLWHGRPQTGAIGTADATDGPSLITLANAIATFATAHFADVVVAATGLGAHVVADTVPTIPTATTASNAQDTIVNLIGTLTTHVERAGVHIGKSAPPQIDTMSSDTPSLCRAANKLKAWCNTHRAGGFASNASA